MNKKLLSSLGVFAVGALIFIASLGVVHTNHQGIHQAFAIAATNTPAATPVANAAYPMMAPISVGTSIAGTIFLRNEGALPVSSVGVMTYTPSLDPNDYDKIYLNSHGWQQGCFGTTTQTAGIATTSAFTTCFTASTNIVQCTDSTAAAAVKCVAGAGTLTITGATGSDTIAFRRIQ